VNSTLTTRMTIGSFFTSSQSYFSQMDANTARAIADHSKKVLTKLAQAEEDSDDED